MTSPNTPNNSASPISIDVRLLGSLLGHVIREQHGDESFQLVEDIRNIAKARRQGDASATDKLITTIRSASLEQKNILIKAFSNYFQLINIAEDQERIRVLRDREAKGTLSEYLYDALEHLRARGMSETRVRQLFEQLRLRFVLTAHPSEAKRTEILIKLRHISQMMMQKERMSMLPRERKAWEAQLLEEIEELWQTRPIRSSQKSVSDEVEFGIYFLTTVIMDVVVDLYSELYDTLEQLYPEENWQDLHRLLRFGSWIGGDRDGNPNVTAEVTLQTLQTMRDAARQVYLRDLHFLEQHLTQMTDTLDDPRLDEAFPTVAASDGERFRAIIRAIRQRLEVDGYRSRIPLLNDLRLVQEALRKHGGQRVAEGKLRSVIRKVRLFGLYLAPLDIREDARLHAQVVAEVFERYGIAKDYLNLPEAEKQALLLREIESRRPLFPSDLSQFSDTAQRVVATWRMIAEAYRRFSVGVIDTFISSMSKQPSDVLTMLMFAHEVGVADNLDLVPLFETIEDLENAPAVIDALFQMPVYRKHLEKRRMRQQIMIGYSDSGKDGGYIASNWYLYEAQQVIAETCARHGISLELFHGRGGSIGRGGGPTNRAILSQPPTSLGGGIKITEQGEVISYRYNNREIARRQLHQVMNAVILALGHASEYQVRPEWSAAMKELSTLGQKAFRSFVYENKHFIDFWQQATPINELSQLRISSRPAKRGDKGGFAAMRAIPWVFSWMQNRAIIPSWYGVGYAFETYCQQIPNGLETLQTMYQNWLFFRALIENCQLDVAKADMGITRLYASLVDDQTMAEEMMGLIESEHARTCRMICQITGQTSILSNSPALLKSIDSRNPYIDPLNFLQVELLRELRQLEPGSDAHTATLDSVLATINGIAAGMKTTG
ncbi:MAG: phosphoenolpyruvate carboxylase [Aggregatilineales bacterium]